MINEQNKTRYYLVNLGAFFSTLPFIAPIPIHSDVQYPIFLLAALIILLDIVSRQFTLQKVELYFLWVAILSLVYINPYLEYNYSVTKRVGLLFGLVLYYVFSRYWRLVNPKYLLAGIYVNFVGVIAHFLIPGPFTRVAGIFTRVIKQVALTGGRGVSGFAPEPGFLGAMSIFFILITYILKRERRISNKQFITVLILSVIMMFMSKSGTSALMLLSLCSLFFFFSKIVLWKKIASVLLLVLSFYTLLYGIGIAGRGANVMRQLLEDPSTLFVQDKSVAYRGVAISTGVMSILEGNLFGHGVGTLRYVSADIIEGTYLGDLYHSVSGRAGALLSALSQYLVELGIFFIYLMVWLYMHAKGHSYVIITRLMSLFYLIASFSILFPPLWIIIASTALCNSSRVQRA